MGAPETWADVVGWEGFYAVSDRGRVRSLLARNRWPAGLILKQYPDRQRGYLRVCLQRPGVYKWSTVHRLVASAFVGSPPTATSQVNHIDGNRTNNAASNLEWVTPRQNVRHAIALGLRGESSFRRGEACELARLTESDVLEIRRRAALGETQQSIGDAFGVHQASVSKIVLRKTWAHI